jgi:hypothetical protein
MQHCTGEPSECGIYSNRDCNPYGDPFANTYSYPFP